MSRLVLGLLRFLFLLVIKYATHALYRLEVDWETEESDEDIRVVALMNHTSLMDFLWIGAAPNRFLWRVARHGVLPGADITLNRPVVGRFFKWLAPDVITITRKRDGTWDEFMGKIRPGSVVILAPEGRMKRPGGLDKQGKPMSVRGGIADILWQIDGGYLLLAFSAGLHHVNVPGSLKVRFFQPIRLRIARFPLPDYKRALGKETFEEFRKAVVADLNRRLAENEKRPPA